MKLPACPWSALAAALSLSTVTTSTALADPLAYVPIASGARVQVLDTRSGATVAQILTAPAPIGIALDLNQGLAYATHQNPPVGSLTRIDLAQRQVTGQLSFASDAWGIALSADGAVAYVSLSGSDQLGVVDTASLSLIETLPTGSAPRDVLISPDGARVYVSNQFGASVTVVDAQTHSVVGTYPVCDTPLGMAMSADSSTLYLSCFTEHRVARLDAQSLNQTGTVSAGQGPSDVALGPDGSRLYVSNTRGNTVGVVTTSPLALVTQIPVGNEPYGLAVSSDGTRVYASNVQSKTLSVIDTGALSVVQTYPLIESAFAVGHFLAPPGVPDPPLIQSAEGSNGGATLHFDPPAFDGGSLITEYTARCGTVQQVGTAPAITLSGLVPGASYSCQVHARNSVGESAPSASLDVIAASVPDAPLPQAAAPGAGQAILSFSAPGDDGGSPITHYSALCEPGALGGNAPQSPISVAGLTDNRVYRCRVQAHNLLGAGPLSTPLRVIPGATGSSADLSISKTNATDFVGGGQRVGYLINVRNAGPAAVVGAQVTDTLETCFSDAQWQCSGTDGGECAVSSAGLGNLDIGVDLPIGASVQIQLSAQLAPVPEDPVYNLAAVLAPVGITELDSSNNVASDGPDVRGVFRDGFE